MDSGATTRRRFALVAAIALSIGAVAAVVGDAIGGVDISTAVMSFQVSNLMLGLPAGVCGVLLLWHRPDNRLGWFLAGCGTAIEVSAVAVPLQVASFDHHWPLADQRTITTIYSSWVLCQFLFLPLTVLFFPDGKLPSPRWRPAVIFVLLTFGVELFRFNAGNNGLATVQRYSDVAAPSWLDTNLFRHLGPAPALEILDYVVISLAIWVRYRRGDERVRRQVLWLLWSMVIAVGLIVLDTTAVAAGSRYAILALGFMGLVPIAMTVAVLRYEVLDIRQVWSRTLAWAILTGAVFGIYFLVVTVTDPLLKGTIPSSAPAAVIVAAGFHPARMRLQRWVDERMYGGRADPVRAATQVSAQISTGIATPIDLLDPICRALRLPYAELSSRGQILGSSGSPVSLTESVPLLRSGLQLGELVVGVRIGQARLNHADRSVLGLLAAPLALALHTAALSAEVQRGAAEVTEARVAERTRLRRDLHDGLGPLLTGIAFQADAAENLHDREPERIPELVRNIRETAAEAIAEVRVLLDQLRPTSVAELGLVSAIEHHAEALAHRRDGTRLMVVVETGDLPPLPQVAETAIFRVVTEALNNVAKHSRAERVDVEIADVGGAIAVTIRDDGGSSAPWTPGIGLRSMAERVEHLGGRFEAGPARIGGHVAAVIPVEVNA